MTSSSKGNWRYPGARWWKFDFHTHTPASSDTPWHALAGQPGELTAEQWLRRYMDAGIDCVAITDHNSGAWIDKIKLAYDAMELSGTAGFRPLHVFPGVELSVNGGFHLLAIFDKEKCTADIDSLLGAVGYDGTKGDSDGVTRVSPVQVVEAVLAAGGLPIPAHADQSKGLLRLQDSQSGKAALDANTLAQVLECPGVLAMEVLDRQAPKPRVYSQRRLSWSEVLGSDCHNFRGQNPPGTRFTWIKMASPSLEGLRLALLDGEGFSVRRSDDPQPFDPFALPEHFVESIAISKARYMGRSDPEKLVFSPWFNALVGGRGTGKSTVVHFLRLGFRREAELRTLDTDHEARRTFDAFAKVPSSKADVGGLEAQTEILITLMRDGVRHQLTWQHGAADGLVQEETDGQWAPSASQLVARERFPLRLFSQGQIGALAGKNQEALLAVIDEAAGVAPQEAALEEASRRFLALQAQDRQLDGQLRGQEPLRVQLEDVRRKLARFENTHHAEVLRAYQIGARQEREMARQLDAADKVAAKVRQVAAELVPDDVPQGLFDVQSPQDQEALAAIERLGLAVLNLGKAIREGAARLQTVIDQERASQSAWHAALADTKSKYLALVEALQAQGVADPSEYAKLVQERQRLEAEWARFESLRKQREQLSVQTMEQTERLLAARRALGVQRQEFLQGSLAENSYVQIATVPYGNEPRALERSLREVLGAVDDRFEDDILSMNGDQATKGLVAELLGVPDQFGFAAPDDPQGVTESRIATCKSRIQRACLGSGDFGGRFNSYLKREFEKSPDFLDRVLTWFPEDALSIKYSRKGDGRDWEPIGQASAGQRAAAMLAFLLAHGREPIILDQPEDDLDNHLIYDLVVRQIRANKLHRQIMVVTHNPNIVVNGDAEMLQAFDFRGGQCRVVQSGSLQDSAMREEICNVMEGGREAFERRYRRLGKEA